MLRMAVMGAHGTGKSTLVSALARALESPVVTVQGIPRNLMRSGYRFGENLRLDSVAAYFVEQRRHEIEGRRRGAATLLTERTLLDAVAYERANRSMHGRGCFSADMSAFMERVAFDHVNTFDRLVYCPILFPLEDDGVRGGSEEYQQSVDHELRALVMSDAVDSPVMVVGGTVEQRVAQVLEALGPSAPGEP
ncbi:AAA family ATPase [Micromonospora trifolii]|uniref:AAA family ATPase n=1 Tax=Micromonospora trifolii TaxID=2911208 RepID=UPI003D2EAF91